MKAFENLAQRGIHYFLAAMPPFRAAPSGSASEKAQENAYNFIRGVYSALYDNPELLGLKIYPDDSFQYWWSKKSEKPGLADKIRGYIKNINLLVETIYTVVSSGEADGDKIALSKEQCDIKPAMLKKLAGFGVTAEKRGEDFLLAFPEGTVNGLKSLASVSAAHSRESATAVHNKPACEFLLFSRGVFCPQAPYTAEVFRELFENKESYDRLIDYFNKRNFIRIDNKEYKTGLRADALSLDYVKFYGKPEGVVGSSWKTKNFGGIEFAYDELNQDCTRVGLHIPYFREVLENADKMSPSLRGFIANWNKCMGCRYCVQTDRSKTKPLRFVKINDSNICSVFTFGYTFNQFYNGAWLASGAIELMEFADELFADRRVEL